LSNSDRTAVATLISVAAHGAIALVGAVAVAHGLSSTPPPQEQQTFPKPKDDEALVIELPTAAGIVEISTEVHPQAAPVEPETPPLAGGAKVAHVDDGSAGKGGDPTVTDKARNLAARADYDETVVSLLTDAQKEQENRLKTSKERKSLVDRRYALEPMELTFVSSGKGFRYERRPFARLDSTFGSKSGAPPTPLGGPLGQGASADGFGDHAATSAGGTKLGSLSPSKPGASYGTSVGMPQILGMSVAKARPHVDKGKPSVTSNDKGSAKDDTDADLAVAALSKSYVSTSTPGGATIGDGKGGSSGGGAPGAGGTSGDGIKSSAFGDGTGSIDGPREERRTRYTIDLNKRLAVLLAKAFPREEEIELRNGTVIIDLTLGKSGNVVDVVVVRSSGFKAFDSNVVTSIRGAGTFEPVPDLLSNGALTLRIPVKGGWELH